LFLRQLAATRVREQRSDRPESADTPSPERRNEIGTSAALQGADLLRLGYSIEQVVHCYGDMCQSVTGLAIEQSMPISTDEFRTLNRCLDNAISEAVAAFGTANQALIDARALNSLPARLAAFVAEQRRLVEIAIQSYAVIRSGSVGVSGATGNLLSHALEELQTLVERTPPEIQVTAATVAAAAAPAQGAI
jgi:aspartyl aminopeptidase